MALWVVERARLTRRSDYDQILMAKQPLEQTRLTETDLDVIPLTPKQDVEQAEQLEREYHGGRSVGWLF